VGRFAGLPGSPDQALYGGAGTRDVFACFATVFASCG
jgi:hypothetical protein